MGRAPDSEGSMIRVTPLGGAPVELPEDTQCVARLLRTDGNITFVIRGVASVTQTNGADDMSRYVWRLDVALDAAPQAFVHLGDAWPLCTIETWRERAERLERELDIVRASLARADADCSLIGQECADCGGALRMSMGAGRKREYRRGCNYDVPADLSFPVCRECGAEWLTDSQLETLNASLEAQRMAREKPSPKTPSV